jgi:hypothetical protein
MKARLTQKDLLFGIYWGTKNSFNPGLSVWFNGRYVWPLKRGHAKFPAKQPPLPFEEKHGPEISAESGKSRA